MWAVVDMERRDLSHKEKLYLREQNVITETQCTLGRNETHCLYVCAKMLVRTLYSITIHIGWLFAGLTALRSDEVIDLMIKEYPSKHSEYSVILQERERQRIAKEYSVSPHRLVYKKEVMLCLKCSLCLSWFFFFLCLAANAAAESSESGGQ